MKLLSRFLPGAVLPALFLFASCRPAPETAAANATPAPAPAPRPATPSPLPVVGPSPEWSLTLLDNSTVGRESLKGKVVVVDFWATWCPPCVHEMPALVRLQEKYRDQGLVIVGITADNNMEILNRFIQQRGVNFSVGLVDTALAELFGEKELLLPTTFLIDREGRIRHRKVGTADPADYERLVSSLL